MDIYEIETILNRVSLHLEETESNLPFSFPTEHEIKRAFDNQELLHSQIVLSKFDIIKKIYKLITN